VMPAPGAKIEAMVERIAVDQFRREGGAFVLGVTGLPADAAPLLALRRCRLGRLDDVGGRRLGRGRGILPRSGELLLETSDGALEHLQPRLLGVQLRLQAPTVRARLPCLGSHDGLCYKHRGEYTTPVNGYAPCTTPRNQILRYRFTILGVRGVCRCRPTLEPETASAQSTDTANAGREFMGREFYYMQRCLLARRC